ncbi:MAG TPA: hypothetical protein VGU71_22280 [Candidatus Dormibacteraeota bacterium]|nr:hypothetical protein [Candidatus Dormibacteraeota bacterium]
MALLQTQVTLNAVTATKLCQARTGRKGLIIKNQDAAIVVTLGGSSVAVSGNAGGYQLKTNDSLQLTDMSASIQSEEWWAIGASGAPIVDVIEQIY